MKLCKGFTLKEVVNGERMETLFAELGDDRVLTTGQVPFSNSFDKAHRVWTEVNAVPEDAEYIGWYPIPGAMPERGV